jgi:hypothetical protein
MKLQYVFVAIFLLFEASVHLVEMIAYTYVSGWNTWSKGMQKIGTRIGQSSES